MAKQKIIAGHLDHKHGYYYMVLSLPNPEKGNRKLPKWFPTGIPYDGKRQTERDAKRMLKEWREDFTSGKLTLAMKMCIRDRVCGARDQPCARRKADICESDGP